MKKTTQLALKRDTREVLDMVRGYDEDMFGRMPVSDGGDLSEFDALPTREVDIDLPTDAEYAEEELLGEPEVFSPPVEEHFPMFGAALAHFSGTETAPRVARLDTEESYGHFVCEKAVKELERRVDELREAFEEHTAETHGGAVRPMRKWDSIIGAAQAVSDLRNAADAHQATSAMPQVPVEVPPFAEGKVKCWKDGEAVVCSVRFLTKDKQPRVLTMAAKPRVNDDKLAAKAVLAGCDPITVLGALPDLSARVCAQRLVKDAVGAAHQVHGRADVQDMVGPALIVRKGDAGKAPLAAMMYVEECARSGDPQACAEMARFEAVSDTVLGAQLVRPLVAEARRRVDVKRSRAATGDPEPEPIQSTIKRFFQRLLTPTTRVRGAEAPSFAQRYALMALAL